MEEKILKSLAIKSLALMFVVILATRGAADYTDAEALAGGSGAEPFSYVREGNRLFLTELGRQLSPEKAQDSQHLAEGTIQEYLGENYLVIAKETREPVSISLEDRYMEKSIRLTVDGLPDKNISYQSVERRHGTAVYRGILLGTPDDKDTVQEIVIRYVYHPDNFTYSAILDLRLDRVYVHKLYEDDNNIYVDLREPHEVYDKIVVVDAGHGGNAIGTYSPGMEYLEKDMNLSILLYLKEYLDNTDIKVYYTRVEDTKVYLNPRIDLANDLNADLFLSVHCNGDTNTSSYGVEALYNEKAPKKGLSSKKLSEICLDELVKATGRRDRGLKPRSDVYIIGKARVPVTLLEVGFLSNSSDLKFLLKEENRKKIAQGIYNGILEALREKDEEL